MRVGILLNRLWGGGAEKVGLGWADGLSDRGHDVVVLQYDPLAGEQPVRPRTASLRSFDGADRRRRWVDLPRWVAQQAEDEHLDVVVSLLTFPNLVLLRALLGRAGRPALVVSEHNLLPAFLQAEGRAGVVKDVLARGLYRRADAVLAPSHAVAACLRSAYGVAGDRLAVVPNPVSGGGPAGPAAGPPRLLLVGRVEAQKRPHLFVDVLGELARRGRPTAGLVVGDGTLAAELVARAVAEGLDVALTGWVARWQDHARRGDVLLLPSSMEGFGNVLVEAAEAGVASVACSEALAVADAVLPGITGELAVGARPNVLADAVLRALALPPPDASLLAPWLSRFSTAGAAEVLEAVLVDAVARRRAA
ncbi:MAG: hypothetical protein JWP95_1436 [Actinotalea sp.]|nr:hypothetical protein [Actinotalea sp.]